VLHQIGVGALGPVFRTYEPTRDRLVAVKVFRLDITPEQAQALADELSHAPEADLFHPSIVEPIAAGVQGMLAYRAEEYVAAESLDVAMRHHAPASFDTMMRIVGQLAEGIDVARRAGVGHGALHPRDIFVTPDEARASGFGVVDALERVGLRAPVRRPYSAPERIAGGAWSTPADVFSLGAIAFELLTGRRPSATGLEIGPLTGAVALGADRLQSVLARAMHDNPEERFPNGLAFAQALAETAGTPEPPGFAAGAVEAPPQPSEGSRSIQMIAIPVEPPQFADEDDGGGSDEVHRPEIPMYADEGAAGIAGDRDQGVAHWALERDEEDEEAVRPEDPGDDEPDVEDGPSGTHAARFAPFDDLHEEPAGEGLVFDAADLALRDEPLSPGAGDEFRFSAQRGQPPVRPEPEPDAAPFFEPAADERQPAAFAPPMFERPVTPPPQIVERDVQRYLAHDPDEPDSYEGVQDAGERGRPTMLPLALMLGLGLVLGFGAGYFAGSRGADPGSEIAATNDSPRVASGDAAGPATAAAPSGRREPPPDPGTEAPAPTTRPSAAAAPAGAARAGKLVVQTTPPGAAVTINGKPSGRAPLTRESLAFGDYTVQVVLPGYQTRNAQVRLSAAAASRTLSMQLQREPGVAARSTTPPPAARTQKPAPVPAAPMARPAPAVSTAATGVLEIDSRPIGAQVFVDGRPVGPTPVRVPDVAPGDRIVRLELAAHRTWTEVAQVTRGRTTRVAGSLEPIR
jgi:serine/threonine protein kinase